MKVCKYDSRHRCFHGTCDYVDNFGNVHVCKHHLNPSGRFMRKREKVSPFVLRCSK